MSRTPADPELGKVSVLIADCDAMVRAWVGEAIDGTEFFLTAKASTAAEALELIETHHPALLLFGYHLPGKPATDLVRGLREAGIATPVLIFTASAERGLNEAGLECGAQGVLRKRDDAAELVAALRDVLAGRRVIDTEHPRRSKNHGPLNPRERLMLLCVAKGRTNVEIAAELLIGVETVKNVLEGTYVKLGVRGRTAAVAEALREGLL